jgi:hypothetical protein
MIAETSKAMRATPVDVGHGASTSESPRQSLLEAPSADSATALAILMVQLQKEQRVYASKSEAAADQAEEAADREHVQKLHEKADATRTEGMVTGLLDIGAGATTIAAGELNGIAKDKEALKLTNQATNLQKWASRVSGTGQLMEGVKMVISGVYRGVEADKEADAAGAEASSRHASRQGDEARHAKKQTDDDIRFVIDWLKKMQDTSNETSNNVARRA